MVRFLTQDIFSVFFSPLLGLLLYVVYTESIYDDGSHENGNPLTRILLSSFSSSSEPQNAAATAALKRKEICFLSLADCESSTPMISSGAAMGERVISYALQFCPRSHPRSLFHANTESPPWWPFLGYKWNWHVLYEWSPRFCQFLIHGTLSNLPHRGLLRGRSWNDLWK